MATVRISSIKVAPDSATVRISSITATIGPPNQNSSIRVASIGAAVAIAPVTIRVSSVKAAVSLASGPTVRIGSINASVGPVGKTARIASMKAVVSLTQPVPVLSPIADQQVNPYNAVTVTASAASGIATLWTWRQISGPAVAITPNGSSVSFIAPAGMDASAVVLGVVANGSTEVQAIVNVYAHTFYMKLGNAWVPVPITTILPT
jgi:hypothetical protein